MASRTAVHALNNKFQFDLFLIKTGVFVYLHQFSTTP